MGRSTLLLITLTISANILLAQKFSGTVNRHEARFTRTVRCQESTTQTGTSTSTGSQPSFAIDSNFGCPAMAFNNGRLALNLPKDRLSATVDNVSTPTLVTLEAPVPTVQATASGAGTMLTQSESSHIYRLTSEIKGVTGCTASYTAEGSRGSPGSST